MDPIENWIALPNSMKAVSQQRLPMVNTTYGLSIGTLVRINSIFTCLIIKSLRTLNENKFHITLHLPITDKFIFLSPYSLTEISKTKICFPK